MRVGGWAPSLLTHAAVNLRMMKEAVQTGDIRYSALVLLFWLSALTDSIYELFLMMEHDARGCLKISSKSRNDDYGKWRTYEENLVYHNMQRKFTVLKMYVCGWDLTTLPGLL